MSDKNRKNTVSQQDGKKAHRHRIRKVRIITAAVTAVILTALIIVGFAAVQSYKSAVNSGDTLRREIAAAGRHYEIDGCMMNYYFNDTYNTFIESYGSYVSYLGLDPSTGLREQTFTDGESWFDFMMRITRTSVSNVIALCEAADEAGISLTEAEMSSLKRRVDRMDTGLYGNGVNHGDIYNAKLLEALAYKYRAITEPTLAPDEAAILTRYSENPYAYLSVDYYKFPMYYPKDTVDADSNADNGDGVRIFTQTEVAELANSLAAISDTDEFIERVRELLLLEDPSLTDSELDSYIDSVKISGVPYSEDDALSQWAFEAKAGETVIVADEQNTTYTVYMLTAEPYTNDMPTVNIRHILLRDETYGSSDGALDKAHELLDTYESGERTAEAFGLLALEFSEEESSYYSGGLYEFVVHGKIAEELDKWCFDTARAPGDTAIIETDYGCHLVRFEEYSYPVWQASIAGEITAERTQAFMNEILSEYPTVFDENVIDMIPD